MNSSLDPFRDQVAKLHAKLFRKPHLKLRILLTTGEGGKVLAMMSMRTNGHTHTHTQTSKMLSNNAINHKIMI